MRGTSPTTPAPFKRLLEQDLTNYPLGVAGSYQDINTWLKTIVVVAGTLVRIDSFSHRYTATRKSTSDKVRLVITDGTTSIVLHETTITAATAYYKSETIGIVLFEGTWTVKTQGYLDSAGAGWTIDDQDIGLALTLASGDI